MNQIDPNEPREAKPGTNQWGLATWLIFAAVIGIGLVVASFMTGGDDAAENAYSGLDDIVNNDPNLPSTSEQAPLFAVPTLDGSVFNLSDHIEADGRPVVLNLWASWCGPCREEMPDIDAAAAAHPEVLFVGVAVKDSEEAATEFAGELGVSYTIGLDNGSVDEAYPVLGLPATFFIAGDGSLVKSHIGIVTVESLDEEIANLFGG